MYLFSTLATHQSHQCPDYHPVHLGQSGFGGGIQASLFLKVSLGDSNGHDGFKPLS